MARIMLIGAEKVRAQMDAMSLKGRSYARLRVGYKAPYAIVQHEDTTLNHPNGGQAKYLEQPARMERANMRQIIKDKLRKQKRGLIDALEAAGNHLLKASLPLVPRDTGALAASGYVEVE